MSNLELERFNYRETRQGQAKVLQSITVTAIKESQILSYLKWILYLMKSLLTVKALVLHISYLRGLTVVC